MHFLVVKTRYHYKKINLFLLTKARAQGFGYIGSWNVYGGEE